MKHAWIMALVLLAWSIGSVGEQRGLVLIEDPDGRPVRLYDKGHALLIGVSRYSSGWPNLPGVKRDLRAVKAALEEHGFEVEVVNDPDQATLENAYERFIGRHGLAPDNRLLFYFAGHGHTVKPVYDLDGNPEDWMGYIVARDAPLPDIDFPGFLEHALSMQRFEELAKQIQSKHALFVFDSCFSGSVFALTRGPPKNISHKMARPVRQFITSGSADQEVPDRSEFRHQFVAALAGAGDLSGDGYITGSELGFFLEEKVTNYSEGSQTPQYGKLRHRLLDKGDFVFSLVTDENDEKSDNRHVEPPIEFSGSRFPPVAPSRSDFVGRVEEINSEYNYIMVKLERPISNSSRLYLKGPGSKRVEIELLDFSNSYASGKPDGGMHRIRMGDPIYATEH